LRMFYVNIWFQKNVNACVVFNSDMRLRLCIVVCELTTVLSDNELAYGILSGPVKVSP